VLSPRGEARGATGFIAFSDFIARLSFSCPPADSQAAAEATMLGFQFSLSSQFIIEMQCAVDTSFIKRAQYYASRVYYSGRNI